MAYKLVMAMTVRPPVETVLVTTTRGDVQATRGHPFWIVGKGWRMASEVQIGDRLHSLAGSATVTAIKTEAAAPVYNLTVADFGTYFVGSGAGSGPRQHAPIAQPCFVAGFRRRTPVNCHDASPLGTTGRGADRGGIGRRCRRSPAGPSPPPTGSQGLHAAAVAPAVLAGAGSPTGTAADSMPANGTAERRQQSPRVFPAASYFLHVAMMHDGDYQKALDGFRSDFTSRPAGGGDALGRLDLLSHHGRRMPRTAWAARPTPWTITTRR